MKNIKLEPKDIIYDVSTPTEDCFEVLASAYLDVFYFSSYDLAVEFAKDAIEEMERQEQEATA